MVHVITAVYNRKDITGQFVECLKKQTYKEIHLLLVDDGSTDGTAQMVRAKFPNSTIIRGNGDLWWGGALHEGYKWIKNNCRNKVEDTVFLSNDDVQLKEDYIEKGIRHLDSYPRDIVSGEGYSLETGELVDTTKNIDYTRNWKEGALYTSDSRTGDCASTRSLFMRVGTMLDVGGFHPILLPHYGSDYEWTIRAARKGHKIYTFEDLHYKYSMTTSGDRSYKNLTFRKLFSKKSVLNPVYKVSYIILTTPAEFLGKELSDQFKRWKMRVRNNKK